MEINWKKLGMEDREIIGHYYGMEPVRNCEFTFANNYLWAPFYDIRYAVVEDMLAFLSEEAEMSVSCPLGKGDRKRTVDALLQYFAQKGKPFQMHLVSPKQFEKLEELYPGRFQVSYDRDAADYVLLMTYEWGYTYGPPMAVAPIHQVRKVVEYALTEIPAEKIDLGIPNYGYNWPLPYERGVTKAAAIGNVQAVRIAVEQGAEIMFDSLAESPYFQYTSEGIEHEVWFEDVRSLQAKFNLIKEYGLRGCGYWQIMKWFRANWVLLQNQFYILK